MEVELMSVKIRASNNKNIIFTFKIVAAGVVLISAYEAVNSDERLIKTLCVQNEEQARLFFEDGDVLKKNQIQSLLELTSTQLNTNISIVGDGASIRDTPDELKDVMKKLTNKNIS
jgi:hypothetical protein